MTWISHSDSHSINGDDVFPLPALKAPTDRQLRYKEKVTELRKKRNSGPLKEQKEKYLVSEWGDLATPRELLDQKVFVVQSRQSRVRFEHLLIP